MKVGVIGPTGLGGSYTCAELISRGHEVVGFSRNPHALGTHPLYTPVTLDLNAQPIEQLVDAWTGLDVLVNAYGPHTAGHEALQYKPFLELTRKIVVAAKAARVGYFVMIGGTGSLFVPGAPYLSVLESKQWWIAYRRGIADSEAHTAYMEDRLGPMGTALREYRNARIAAREGRETAESRRVIYAYEENLKKNSDKALVFITACRTSFMFFDGDTSFDWTFVSPSSLYRSGPKSGKEYHVVYDYLPLKGDPADGSNLDGRLLGITSADFAAALVDEAENRVHKGRHWSVYGDLSNDVPTSSYVRIDNL